ncbi:MFS transporter [Sphingomonas colocasiae]|uniref:MFS transporter n=1 Tax=Sphingomonas colocasiae TaxID=1848973 RepID=A0ABS7PNP8_9SPHN|nr:MFS transporter [Sphingomonas colocasiae]MBY8822841.1 MFS transporter [Sphingomonas colocasiae]
MTTTPSRHVGTFLLIVSGTVIGIAGTDLILPAVPGLPAALGGDLPRAQLVLASFTAGAAAGLLFFGELGARFDQRRLLAVSLLAYGSISLICSFSPSLDALIALRFLQGASGAAAAVFAPGLLRLLYGDGRAVGALGLLGSIESLVPALAPLVGLWLLGLWGWRASFDVLAALGFALAAITLLRHHHLPRPAASRNGGGYLRLLSDPVFMRYALSHACTLGALLVFVFGAPTVFTVVMGGGIADFITMQMSGIACFVVASNLAGTCARRFGAEPMILLGNVISAAGGVAMLGYALAGGTDPLGVTAIFLLFNIGLGLRGPPGFHRAVVASRGDDARGAALVIVAILLVTSLGTASVAPFIERGLVPLSAGAALIAVSGVLLLLLLPPLKHES